MKTIRCLVVCFSLSVLVPVAAAAQTDSDFKLGHDFTGLKTFSFGTTEAQETSRGNTT